MSANAFPQRRVTRAKLEERGYPRVPAERVHAQVPTLSLGSDRVLPPRAAGATGHCPSGHRGQDRCYLSAVTERDGGTHRGYC